MKHIKYFLTGFLFVGITTAVIFGVVGGGIALLTFLAAQFTVTVPALVINIIGIGILIAIGLFLLSLMYLMGKDYWQQKHLDEVNDKYLKWRAEYYASLKDEENAE